MHQLQVCNGPGFDPSIRRHSGIWGAPDEALLNIVRKKAYYVKKARLFPTFFLQLVYIRSWNRNRNLSKVGTGTGSASLRNKYFLTPAPEPSPCYRCAACRKLFDSAEEKADHVCVIPDRLACRQGLRNMFPSDPDPFSMIWNKSESECQHIIYYLHFFKTVNKRILGTSVADPDPNPDPSDPYVFEPPGSGSGSFYYQEKLVRKTLIPSVLRLIFDFVSLKNYLNVPSKSTVISRKTFFKKYVFCWHQ